MLRERLGEHCAERIFVGTVCLERVWGNTVLSESLGEHRNEREIGGNLAKRDFVRTLC